MSKNEHVSRVGDPLKWDLPPQTLEARGRVVRVMTRKVGNLASNDILPPIEVVYPEDTQSTEPTPQANS